MKIHAWVAPLSFMACGAFAACGSNTDAAFGDPSGAGGASGTTTGTGSSTSSTSGGGGMGGCSAATDCDDGISCTTDACQAGVCAHAPGPPSGPTACPPGQFCDVIEGCVPGVACADTAQCLAEYAGDNCKTGIECDPVLALCTYQQLDKDEDGHPPAVCGGDDCNDDDAGAYPGAPETCDGNDDDCDQQVDEGATCPGLTTCQSGACACPAANACGAECVDKSSDESHCGGCFIACPSAATCQSGQCVCSASATICNGLCVDTQVDPLNCGGCNSQCAPGYSCAGGNCTCLLTPCNGGCIDTSSDEQNCGGCNVKCPAGATCLNGGCQCPVGLTLCGGQCVDTKTNPAHCGACNSFCAGVCQNGSCQQCPVANLHILQDVSGSMADAAIGGTKLDVSRSGINAFMNEPASSGMGLGVVYSPIAGGATTCVIDADCGPGGFCFGGTCFPGSTDSCTVADYAAPAVGIALLPGVKPAINNSLAAQTAVGGSTPPPGLQGALQYAKSYAASNPTQKVGLVLIADGLPNICTNNPDVPTDLLPIVSQYASGAPPVVTYVIGIGSGVTLANWNQIAAAGGTGSAYLASSAAEVQSALASIRTGFKVCP